MADYDFTGLSPSDFESLCHDLLEPSLGVKLQGFVTGRDKGIDLRHAPAVGKDWIVQCKHFARSGYAKLRSHVKTKELPKIKKLKPGRYFLATSVGLSPANVDELFELLSPFCQNKHDILGRDDLNALLRQHPSVENAHFKLWLTSEAVLSRVLHNDVFIQSWITEEQIRQKLSLYVHTGSFEKAKVMLNQKRVCILSGVPGVGKTTLAEMLLVEYLMRDWHLVVVGQNIAEGHKVYSKDMMVKQVFYYDDFLGQISTGEKLHKNEAKVLLQLIEHVTRTPNRRFVLTTREYILAQAKAEDEHLARSDIDLFRFVVACDDYSEVDKAQILANHLYFAHVPQAHIAALVEGRTYRQIINHRNYSPRIIEWMTRVKSTLACSAKKYPAAFLSGLDNPTELWTHAFENQISEGSRHLLLTLGSCGDGVFSTDLKEAFEAFYLGRANKYGFTTSPTSFTKALEELEGTFIRIEHNDVRRSDGQAESQIVVSCHNPSILDFLNIRFSHSPHDRSDLLASSVYFEQVERLLLVLWREPAAGSKKKPQIAVKPTVIVEAIHRTIMARSIRLAQYEWTGGQWVPRPGNLWGRLWTCCRIGSQIEDEDLREVIQEHIDTHLASITHRAFELEDIVQLLDAIAECDWCEQGVVERWCDGMRAMLLSKEGSFDECLDGLVAGTQWFVRNRKRFTKDEASSLARNLASAVGHVVEDQSDRDNAEGLSDDLAAVERIGKLLDHNFQDEVRWLNEALSECGSHDGDDRGDSLQGRRTNSSVSSIESLFEALLE